MIIRISPPKIRQPFGIVDIGFRCGRFFGIVDDKIGRFYQRPCIFPATLYCCIIIGYRLLVKFAVFLLVAYRMGGNIVAHPLVSHPLIIT
jgi:hypothetical protein